MLVLTIKAKSISGSDIFLEDIGITIPVSSFLTLSDLFTLTEISSSLDLYNEVDNDNIIINNGTIDLEKSVALEYITLETIPSIEGVVTIEEDNVVVANNVNTINFEGFVNVTEDSTGHVTVEVLGSDSTSDIIIDTDELVKVSANDATASYLIEKLEEGKNISLEEVNDGGNERVKVSCDLDLFHELDDIPHPPQDGEDYLLQYDGTAYIWITHDELESGVASGITFGMSDHASRDYVGNSDSSGYTVMRSFIYDGSFTADNFTIIASRAGQPATGTARIYDYTNNQVIATVTWSDENKAYYTTTNITNLPTGTAIFELQTITSQNGREVRIHYMALY